LCRTGKAEEALRHLREIMGKLKLTVNEEKTQICRMPEGEFDFLGYTFGRLYSPKTGDSYWGVRPSKKSIKRMVEKIHALTGRKWTWQETTDLVGKINRSHEFIRRFLIHVLPRGFHRIRHYGLFSRAPIQ
jgi:RNA-directed DNA polymerase